jgi:drug/metabolite transporter (DMT)-like permease
MNNDDGNCPPFTELLKAVENEKLKNATENELTNEECLKNDTVTVKLLNEEMSVINIYPTKNDKIVKTSHSDACGRLIERFGEHLKRIKAIQGYMYGILFAFSICMANILVKMAPTLDAGNHGCIRYFIQLIFMSAFIKKNNLEFFGPTSQRRLLFFRGFTGAISIILSFSAIRYLDVSDVETITNSNVLITAIFSRLFLNERMTISHVVALALNIVGVIFVLRPSFLFGIEQNIEHMFHVNLTQSHPIVSTTFSNYTSLNSTANLLNWPKHKSTDIIDHSNREMYESIFGVCLVLLSASAMSISHVAVRKLSLGKIHFSVSSIYPAFIGKCNFLITKFTKVRSNSTPCFYRTQSYRLAF